MPALMSAGPGGVRVEHVRNGEAAVTDSGTLSPQPWPWRGRARVLVEHADPSAGLAFTSALRQAGYAVAVCPGPESSQRCPLAGEEGCAIAHDADAVFFALGFGTAAARQVLLSLKTSFPATPIFVEATARESAEWPELAAGCAVVAPAVAPDRLVALVGGALARRGRA
ncbi:MAG TPA: hypothetical protein VFT80_14055 [Actinomycetota bacterium]|nr:hypothetical protein [Actinomycetota bacterium]